jgi:hypothetical protein
MRPKASLETRKKIYESLCYVLSDRANQVHWDEYAPADWDLFHQMADREGVAPLMYWKLKDSPVAVPHSTFDLLRSTYYQTLAQNTLMYQELGRILGALDEAGIPVIMLKGAALAATVYEDIGLRPMGDLDLLVKREQIDQTMQVLDRIGFKVSDNPGLAPWLGRIAKHDVQFYGGVQGELMIELHWNLVAGDADWRSPSLEWFWKQTEPFVPAEKDQDLMEDRMVPTSPLLLCLNLRPSAQILYLTAHLMIQHGRYSERLLWFYDLYLLVGKMEQDVNWKELLAKAKEYNWIASLYSTLSRVRILFDVQVPIFVCADLSQELGQCTRPVRLIRRKSSSLQTSATYKLDRLLTLDLIDGLKYAIATVLPSPAYMRWRYRPKPGWFWPLYYPYRWFRMLREVIYTISKILLPRRS